MDSLSQLIALLAPESSIDLHCRFAGRWASDHAQSLVGHIPWHAILSGNARLVLNGGVITAQAGDIFLLPHGAPHRLESHKQNGARAPVQRHENAVITEVVTEGDDAPLVMLAASFVPASAARCCSAGSLRCNVSPQARGMTAARWRRC